MLKVFLYLPLIYTSNKADRRRLKLINMFFIRGLSDRMCRENVATGDRKKWGENFTCSINYAVIFRSNVDCGSSQKYVKQGFGEELSPRKVKMP